MRKSKIQGFSLVEVVLALGVVAFAFVAILGLIPAGMGTFRQAINISVCSQIGQKVIGDAFQADYDTLLTPLGQSQDTVSTFVMNYRFFDEEGNEIFPSPRPTSYTQNVAPSEPFTYLVITKISPYIILPGLSATTQSLFVLPPDASPQTATITVQVVFDPSQYMPSLSTDFYGSANGPTAQSVDTLNSPKIPPGNVFTYYAHITRN